MTPQEEQTMTTRWTGTRQDGTGYTAVLNNQQIEWAFGDKTVTTSAPPKAALVNLKAAGYNPVTHIALHTVDGKMMVAPKDMVEQICNDLRPAPKPTSLSEQRAAIVSRIAGARDAAQAARTRAWESEDAQRGVSDNEYDARAEAAEAELVQFDAVHPEVKAQFDAEREARTDRNIWN
jgi:hypothetical protein